MKIVIDLLTGAVAGSTTDPAFSLSAQQAMVDVPGGFNMAESNEWYYDGTRLVHDLVMVLNQVKVARKARIKIEATAMIDGTAWRLQRAQEREIAGWGTLVDIDAILAERESIRRSSGAAEMAVDALTDTASVQHFAWSVDVPVTAPHRLTQTQFVGRFTDAEATAVLVASDGNTSLRLFWQKMMMASWINLEDPATQAGINALEIAGLINAGRAKKILA